MDEGGRTIGVWLPLALADIYAMLFGVTRMLAAEPDKVTIPRRSEALASWCLPIMSKSIKAAEDEADALALLESVRNLAKKKEAKQ